MLYDYSLGGDNPGTDMPSVRTDETKKEVTGEPTQQDIDGDDPDVAPETK